MRQPWAPPGVRLRTLVESDAAELYAAIEMNRMYLAEWMPWAKNQTLEGTSDFINAAEAQRADESGFHLAILCAARISGVVGMHPIDDAHRTVHWATGLSRRNRARESRQTRYVH